MQDIKPASNTINSLEIEDFIFKSLLFMDLDFAVIVKEDNRVNHRFRHAYF